MSKRNIFEKYAERALEEAANAPLWDDELIVEGNRIVGRVPRRKKEEISTCRKN
jgi:hypothetical protein